MALHVHRSNRAEVLVDSLTALVRQPLADPLAPEHVVVQGEGMERWLSMQLAERLGVWANPSFPFPRHFLAKVFLEVLGEAGTLDPVYEPETMLWSLAELLGRCESEPGFEPVRNFLAGEDRERKHLQLAERLARAFDEYVAYRPRMVLDWEGEQPHWQAVLWRRLVERHGRRHLAAVAADFAAAVASGRAAVAGLSPRVSVFGVSTLAPLYLELFQVLARVSDVHFFLLAPSSEYWATIQSPSETRRAIERHGGAPEDAHADVGHPLLASLGRLGRDFLDRIVEAGGREDDVFVEPGDRCVLHVLQSDLLHLRTRGVSGTPEFGDEPAADPLPVDAGDRSIQVHSCHGAMREIEVLHDRLLDLFERHPTLEPRDVVVLAPAIGTYAPFIDAVFGSRREPRVPYRIADRGARSTGDLVDAFLTTLEILRGRLPAPAVLDLLGFAGIRARFQFDEDDVDRIHDWVAEAGIRWGADAAHREAERQPALGANTWRFGLDRLLLGYAIAGDGRTVFGEVLPCDGVEGGETAVLGRFADFCETLTSARTRVGQPRRVDEWEDLLTELLVVLIARDDETLHEHQRIRDAISTVAARAGAVGFEGAVDLASVAEQVEGELERGRSVHGFLGGGVTFCELVPMRSIPFRVVCLIGMNDSDFPRIRQRPGFDLIGAEPRPGDRSPRDDDRYLFLEAVLSARDHLVITYTGQSIIDNTPIQPSVVVSELLDTLDRGFRRHDDGRVSAHVVVRHPLQPFSPENFGARGDERLFSYVESYCDGARALGSSRGRAPVFVQERLAPPESSEVVDLDALARFFSNPARAFVQQRLGLFLSIDLPELQDREPTELDNLEQWRIGDDLLRRRMRGEALDQTLLPVRAGGVLPPGVPGDVLHGNLSAAVGSIARRGAIVSAGETGLVEIDLPDLGVAGVLRGIGPAGLVRLIYSKPSTKYELDLWIRHLALNAQGRALPSTLVGRDGAVRLEPRADAAEVLGALVRLYRAGLEAPLPFFPKASHDFAKRIAKDATMEDALRSARREFVTESRNAPPPEAADPYVAQVYRGTDPITSTPGSAGSELSFTEVAQLVFDPFLEVRGTVK
jgi:exodeoxyribonuclease V gamma subunit